MDGPQDTQAVEVSTLRHGQLMHSLLAAKPRELDLRDDCREGGFRCLPGSREMLEVDRGKFRGYDVG